MSNDGVSIIVGSVVKDSDGGIGTVIEHSDKNPSFFKVQYKVSFGKYRSYWCLYRNLTMVGEQHIEISASLDDSARCQIVQQNRTQQGGTDEKRVS